jgi:hypothetical protein
MTESQEKPRKCEDCEDEVDHRRLRCPHCKLLLCRWCYGYTHGLLLVGTKYDCVKRQES